MSFQQDRNQADTIDANVSVRKNNRCMIGQIFTANNEKQHFWRKHKAFNAHIYFNKVTIRRNERQTRNLHIRMQENAAQGIRQSPPPLNMHPCSIQCSSVQFWDLDPALYQGT